METTLPLHLLAPENIDSKMDGEEVDLPTDTDMPPVDNVSDSDGVEAESTKKVVVTLANLTPQNASHHGPACGYLRTFRGHQSKLRSRLGTGFLSARA